MHLHIIHGPNLNKLGEREPEIYGDQTLEQINAAIETKATHLGHRTDFFQSNHEGQLIDHIQSLSGDGLIINPASFTHTSLAIRDALAMLEMPIIEVHLSNIYKRESIRHHSITAPVCQGQISGFGPIGYLMALDYFQ